MDVKFFRNNSRLLVLILDSEFSLSMIDDRMSILTFRLHTLNQVEMEAPIPPLSPFGIPYLPDYPAYYRLRLRLFVSAGEVYVSSLKNVSFN